VEAHHDHDEEAAEHCCQALEALACAAAALHRQGNCCNHNQVKKECCQFALGHVLQALESQTHFLKDHCSSV
jgi:hypothetical protein